MSCGRTIVTMRADVVIDVLTTITDRRIDTWIGGGWGIDALVGTQTREHDDLDLLIRGDDEVAVRSLLNSRGFEIVTDWRPTRVALRHPDLGEIDVHAIQFRDDGSAWLPGLDCTAFEYPANAFTTGIIEGHRVNCITAQQQLAFHLGYQPKPKDRADMDTLADAGLIALTRAYRRDRD